MDVLILGFGVNIPKILLNWDMDIDLGFLGKYTSFLFLWVNMPRIWINLKKWFHFPNMCVNNNKEDH